MKYIHQIIFALSLVVPNPASAQSTMLKGKVLDSSGQPVPFAHVRPEEFSDQGTAADTLGFFTIPVEGPGPWKLQVTALGYETQTLLISQSTSLHKIILRPAEKQLDEIVISATMDEVMKSESTVNVDVFTASFLKRNPVASLFEAINLANGVQSQVNCNVCGTGDIHINGLEGPYTMVTIDGMPIVSSLSTVYGLMGIPIGMIDRIEVIKGPYSTLYGSDAVAGIINVITKNPISAPLFWIDVNSNTWLETNTDLGLKIKLGKWNGLLGLNHYNFPLRIDQNNDGFTDLPLQHRISIFNKWQKQRKDNKTTSLAVRYFYEDRFGGQMHWTPKYRGGDSIYGESIFTNRFELIGQYQLPVKPKIFAQLSYNYHDQNSVYGKIPYHANQHTGFGQMYWKTSFLKRHELLTGLALRMQRYDDNTLATSSVNDGAEINRPQLIWLPGIFVQHEGKFGEKHTLLSGVRAEYDSRHGGIFAPRVNYKWKFLADQAIRIGAGNGYRVVNVFTEEHAAVTGARQLVVASNLRPEESLNTSVNYSGRFFPKPGWIQVDMSGFFTYFFNRILPDYDTDPELLIYDNAPGHSITGGISADLEVHLKNSFKLRLGATWMNALQTIEDPLGNLAMERMYHAPDFTSTYMISYTIPKVKLTADLSGKIYGPMRLPIQPNDFRPEFSPWFNLMNIQLTYPTKFGLDIYMGVKNIFNFLPAHPLMRPFDPFNKTADDPVSNPNGYTFDTAYNYAPLQGIRGFVGVRYALKGKSN